MKQRHLFPWILGTLCVSAAAVAITALSSNRIAAPAKLAPVTTAQSVPAAVPSAAAEPVESSPAAMPESDQTAQQSAPVAVAADESAATSGQIWECTTKGVKTFSNNPCGEKSTLLEVGPVNTMNPTPAVHYARSYSTPPYAPPYADSDGADQESYSGDGGVESAGGSYAVVRGVGFIPRRHPEHPHHRPTPNHHSGPMQRKF